MKKRIGWVFLIVLVVILSTGCSDEGETAGTPKPPTGAAIGEPVCKYGQYVSGREGGRHFRTV